VAWCGVRRSSPSLMDFTTEPPFSALKKVVLEYLRNGCAAHDVEPQFVNVDGALPWQFLNEDEFRNIEPPSFLVAMDGEPDQLTETWPQGWIVPLVVNFYCPLSATEEWVQSVQDMMFRLFNGVWHEDELINPAERTPLAIRLSKVAEVMDPQVRIYVAFTTATIPRRIGIIGQTAEVRMDLDVCVCMYAVD
jgi:hypothetical protein